MSHLQRPTIALESGGPARTRTCLIGTVLGLRIQSQHDYLVVAFLQATGIQQWLADERSHLIILHHFSTTNVTLVAVAIAYLSKRVRN